MKPNPVSESDHFSGPLDAPLTLIEYGDYECPFCAKAYPVIEKVRESFGDKLCFVYRHVPKSGAKSFAKQMAEAAEFAASTGQFWSMHEALFTQPDWRDLEQLVSRPRPSGSIPKRVVRRSWNEPSPSVCAKSRWRPSGAASSARLLSSSTESATRTGWRRSRSRARSKPRWPRKLRPGATPSYSFGRSSKDSTAKVTTGSVLPLTAVARHWPHGEAVVERLSHRFGHQNVDAVRSRETLHARREVHCVADHRKLRQVIAAHHPGNGSPRVDADAEGKARQPALGERSVVLFERRPASTVRRAPHPPPATGCDRTSRKAPSGRRPSNARGVRGAR